MRFYECNKGEVLIDGCSINNTRIDSLREQIALVSQDITLFDGTVKDNIGYGDANPEDSLIIDAATEAYAMEFIEKLDEGLDAKIGEHGIKLSGGQRQRLAFARAMYKNAPILILDEATSALDTKSERYIQEALEKVQKNRTVLVIAHRLSTIENADVIFVMEHGEIVERGSHQELLDKSGKYGRLHNLQFKGALSKR
jgi:subfamily B ATP-binding cassette protein MsbA